MKYFIVLILFFVEISIQARDISAPETISVNETVGNIILGNQNDVTIASGVTLIVTGNIFLGEESDVLGSGVLQLGGTESQTITLTSVNWYKTSIIASLRIGNFSVIISKGANRQLSITNIDYNCIPSAVDLAALNNTPLGTNVVPPVPAAISSTSPQCAGTGITFTQGSCSVGTCYWVSTSTGIETSNSVSTKMSATAVGTYPVYVRAKNGTCWSDAVSSIGTIVSPPTTATNGSTQTICANGSATLSGNNPTIGTGTWTVSGPSTSLAQFANTSGYNTIFTPLGGIGSYIVSWTISNGVCSTYANATITVNAIPTAAGFVTGGTIQCAGSTSGILTLTGNSNSITKWQSSTVSDFSSNITETVSTTNTYTSGSLSATSYFRAVTSNGTCNGYSSSTTVVINPSIPSPAGSISGTVIQCSGSTGQVYSVSSVNNASAYSWTVPTGWTIISGQGTTAIIVTTGTTGQNGSITVTPSNICGSSAVSILAVSVVSVSSPATPGLISGNGTVCHTVPGQIYSISPVPNASKYTWSVPTGWSINAGVGTTSLTVTSGESNTTGNISVTVGNACGVSSPQTLVVTVVAGSTAPTSITGNASVCFGKGITLTATDGTSYSGCTYQWGTGTVGSNIISGAISSSYSVTPSVGNVTTTYWTRRMDASPCNVVPTDGVTKSVFIGVMPTVTISTNSPVSTNGTLSLVAGPDNMTNYVWSSTGTLFTTNTQLAQIQRPSINYPTTAYTGTYTVSVTGNGGCVGTASTVVTVNASSTYIWSSEGTVNLNTLSGWSPTTATFTAGNNTFVINPTSGTKTVTLSSDWQVSGANTKIIVGDGTNAVNLVIPGSLTKSLTGSGASIDVKNNSTLTIETEYVPNLGILAQDVTAVTSGSKVVFGGTKAQIIPGAKYWNLTITGARGSNNISFENNGTISVANKFDVTTSPPTFNSGFGYNTTNNTFVFDGPNYYPNNPPSAPTLFSQEIPSFTFFNLQTQGGKKLLKGNVTVNNVLTVGRISTLDLNAKNLTLSGAGTPLVVLGTFTSTAPSTVYYTNASNTIIAAVNYNSLNLTGGIRTLPTNGIVSISGDFITGTGPFTATGSTVQFNGTTSRTIPLFLYNNLTINSGTTVSPSVVTLGGAVTVGGTLLMNIGILTTTTTNLLTVSNTSDTAVGGGATFSFVNGPIKRMLPSSMLANSNYSFPVGSGTTYLPFFINGIYGTATYATVQANNQTLTAGSGGVITGTGLKSISTSEYWSLSHDNTLTAKVTLSRQSDVDASGVIGHCSACIQGSPGGTYNSIGGNANTSTKTIQNSNSTTFSTLIVAVSLTPPVIYYYDGTDDITNTNNWVLSSDLVTHPASFTIDNATYVVKNTTAVSIGSNWIISGSNTTLQVGDGATTTNLTVLSGVILTVSGDVLLSCKGALITTATSIVTVAGNLTTLGDCSSIPGPILNNAGTLNISNGFGSISNANNNLVVNNTGIMNITSDLFVNGSTVFNNYGTTNVTNGSFVVNGGPSLFNNKIGGIVTINDANDSQDSVLFANNNGAISLVNFDAGSTFNVIGTNVSFAGGGSNNMIINGVVNVKNGNINANSSGGNTFTINSTGSVNAYDVLPVTGSGIINFGGIKVLVSGKLYAEGIIETGGSNSFTVSIGGTTFIGNAGLINTGSNSNTFTVDAGGTLNYCGNKSTGADNLGKIYGTINFANGFYDNTNPFDQVDFTKYDAGTQNIAFADWNSCLAAFNTLNYIYTGSVTALPIELYYFNVKQNGETVAIEWSTASETNNDFFTVLKSYDASSFEGIGDLSGEGTSTAKHSYRFEDEKPQIGINYYKLKQTDFDGNFTLGPVKSVNYTSKNIGFEVYPNPSKFENITIVLSARRTEEIKLLITNEKGSEVFSTNLAVEDGKKKILLLDYTFLNTGTYYVSIIGSNFFETKKVIVE